MTTHEKTANIQTDVKPQADFRSISANDLPPGPKPIEWTPEEIAAIRWDAHKEATGKYLPDLK